MWKNKLEDTSELSFATLQNKDAAWEKLQARLENKLQKNRLAWYWLAAACILIAAIISFFTMHPQNNIAQHPSINNSNKKTIAKKDEPVKNITIENASDNQLKKQLQQNNIVKAKEKKTIVIDSSSHIAVTNNLQQPPNENITRLTITDTNAIAIVSPTINQKKLKVVHVNELGEPVEFPADVAHTTNLHLFQLKLAQQEIYNTSSTATNNNPGILFKPKKSSN